MISLKYTVETTEETSAEIKPKAVSDADRLNYSLSKVTVRLYSDDMYSDPD